MRYFNIFRHWMLPFFILCSHAMNHHVSIFTWLVEGFARNSFEFGMFCNDAEFVFPVSELTLISKLANASLNKSLAYLGLVPLSVELCPVEWTWCRSWPTTSSHKFQHFSLKFKMKTIMKVWRTAYLFIFVDDILWARRYWSAWIGSIWVSFVQFGIVVLFYCVKSVSPFYSINILLQLC